MSNTIPLEVIGMNSMTMLGMTQEQYDNMSANIGAMSNRVAKRKDGGLDVYLDKGVATLYDKKREIRLDDGVEIEVIEQLRRAAILGGNE